MIEVRPKEIDPEKVKYQLDLLVSAIWGVAEDELAEELRAKKKPQSTPSTSKAS